MNAKIAEIKIAILEDKKKAGVLAALALIALVVGVRALVKTSPKRAAAASTSTTTLPGSTAAGSITLQAVDPAKLAETMRRYAIADQIQRDPFALDPDAFPPAEAPKSGSASSEDQDSQTVSPQTAAERAAESVRHMRVRSVITGPRPLAVIEWRADTAARSYTLAVGDQLDGFTVASITQRDVALTRDGATYTLSIDTPSK